jgi:thiamine-monophosphate kinase
MRGEFELIAEHFAPLAKADGTFGLRNDAALLTPGPGEEIAATLDTMVAGVHFHRDEAPDVVARRLLRVNLSDLAAMGAQPLGYLLSLSVTEDIDDDWVASFARGLAEDQEEFGVTLLGGDTVRSSGPQCLSLTALGSVSKAAALAREGAVPGDLVFLSGCLGDAALGLDCLEGKFPKLPAADAQALIARFGLPQPRLALGRALGGLNRRRHEAGLRGLAALDVSDGLLADLAHLTCEQGIGAELELARLPLSAQVRRLLAEDAALMERVLTGGDDYELLFLADQALESEIAELASAAHTPVARIGRVTAVAEIAARRSDGTLFQTGQSGWRHF